MSNMIQLSTVGHRSEPADYWDSDFFHTETYDGGGKERTAVIANTNSIEEVIEVAGHSSFIVSTNPGKPYSAHPDADARIRVYDGYNE